MTEYISHLDADHIGGLQWLAYGHFFGDGPRPKLYICKDILPGLRDSLGPMTREVNGRTQELEDYFEIIDTPSDGSVSFGNSLTGYIKKVIHGDGVIKKYSYGLYFTKENDSDATLYWTSDAIFDPKNSQWNYDCADIILQDCELGFATGVHAHLDELRKLPPNTKKRMWLYHHNPALIPTEIAESGEFAGFVRKGQVFQF